MDGDSEDKKVTGQVNTALHENGQLLSGYRSVGEMLYRDEKFRLSKRNHEGYDNMVNNKDLVSEVSLLFRTQRKLGSLVASVDFEKSYLEILQFRYPSVTIKNTLKNTDRCPIIPSEYVGCSRQYTVEYFINRSALNNSTYTTSDGGVYSFSVSQLVNSEEN